MPLPPDEAVNAYRGENLWYGNNHPNTLPVQIAKNGANISLHRLDQIAQALDRDTSELVKDAA